MIDRNSKKNPGYRVIVNKEGQFCIWQSDIEISSGWQDTGISGSKETCADYIKTHWTDLRPVSLQKQMDK